MTLSDIQRTNLCSRGLFWKDQLLQHDPSRPEAVKGVTDTLDAWLRELSGTAPIGVANRIPSSEIWASTKDLLELGWLQNRARLKPRGYAGDYELFARICDQTLSDDPWGKVFDQYFQSQAAPRAVRARTTYVSAAIVDLIQKHSVKHKIVSIGSGPARDIRDACRQLSQEDLARLDVYLVDIDPDALDYAAASLQNFLQPEQIHLERQNLFRLPRNVAVQKQLADASIVSCMGLFDYLADDQAVAMLTCFDNWLRPGGRGIVFHFSPANPTRAYMEWIANWYLNYRTAEELYSLADKASLPTSRQLVSLVDGLALGLDWVRSA